MHLIVHIQCPKVHIIDPNVHIQCPKVHITDPNVHIHCPKIHIVDLIIKNEFF